MNITESRVPLATGTPIEQYSIVKVLTSDELSIHYKAICSTSNRLVIVEELFPAALANRRSSFSDISLIDANKSKSLQDSIANFSRVVQLLLHCEHPNLNRTIACLQHGGTVLSVHEKLDYTSLLQHAQQQLKSVLKEDDIRLMLPPLLHGLNYLHSKGILHLGIQPEYILLKDLATPILTHFSQSQCIGNASSLAGMLSLESVPAQLAPELLSKKSIVTPASDIYALGITLYGLMTGLELPLAQDRLNAILDNEPDPLPPLREHAAGYSPSLYHLVESCVRLRQKDRPQSIREVLEALDNNTAPNTLAKTSAAQLVKTTPPQNKQMTKPQAAITPVHSKPVTRIESTAQHPPAAEVVESPKIIRNLQYAAAAVVVGLIISTTYVISKPSADDQQLLTQHHSMERLAHMEAVRLENIKQLYQLVSIPAGRFTMGCDTSQCPESERPTRSIDVPDLTMMAHQVTFTMWDTCVEQGGCSHRPRDEGGGVEVTVRLLM